MKKRVIAIDCDDVIVKTAEITLEHYNRRYGTSVKLEHLYSGDITVWGVDSEATAIKRFHEFIKTDAFVHQHPMQEALEVINWLKNHHELHIVTGRPHFIEEATVAWLTQHFPQTFKSAVFTDFYKLDADGNERVKARSKAEVCQEIGADILVEDHLGHALGVAEAGIDVLLFGDYPWNKAETLPPNVYRAKDWQAVKEFFNAPS